MNRQAKPSTTALAVASPSATRAALVIALFAMLTGACVLVAYPWRPRVPPRPTAAPRDTMALRRPPRLPAADAQDPTSLKRMIGSGDVTPLMMLHENDRPIGHPPGGLPTHPDATRISCFERDAGRIREQVGFWSVGKTPVDAVAGFYHEAIRSAGFRTVPSLRGDQRSGARGERRINRVYARRDPDQPDKLQSLVLRVSQRPGKETHLMLWLRYPMGRRSRTEERSDAAAPTLDPDVGVVTDGNR